MDVWEAITHAVDTMSNLDITEFEQAQQAICYMSRGLVWNGA